MSEKELILEILLSCMNQIDISLAEKSHITGNLLMVNQCDFVDYSEVKTASGLIRMFSTTDRGLTRSRNMAIEYSNADICLLADDDETFVDDYENRIIKAYKKLPDADIIVFQMTNYDTGLPKRETRIKFPTTMHVCSWQISFRRQSLIDSGVRFDTLLGAGTGNGAEEELKFLIDAQRAGLKIYSVPTQIASVAQSQSTWRFAYDETFFKNRGTTTRYILGPIISRLYAIYYVARKRNMYSKDIKPLQALTATYAGIRENRLGHQAKQVREK